MLDIDKDKLREKYIQGDMNYFFDKAEKITDFLLSRSFKVFNPDVREDMTQECLMNLWKKIEQGKVDSSKNLMSFIWQNSTYRALEIFRKERDRNRIASFVSLDTVLSDVYLVETGYKYCEV